MASSQVPSYIQDLIRQRAQQYGVDPTLLSRIARVESSYNPRAGASTSSAKGLFQFTNPTWARYGRGNVYDPEANADAGARFTAENIQGLRDTGYPTSPGNVYLAHFAGLGGARKVLGADPSTPVSRVLDPAAIKANPFLRGMRVADLRQWAASKMGGLLDPAAPSVPGASPALAGPTGGTTLTASAVGLDPADRSALASWSPKPVPPVAAAVSAPSGIDPTSVDRANVLNPADRAAVNAMYPPGGAAPPLPAPAVVARATPATPPLPSEVPPAKPPAGSVSVPSGSQEEADLVAAHQDEQPGGLLNLTADQGSNLASFASRLPGILNAQSNELQTPELAMLPARGTLESPLTAMVRQAKQQKIQQGLAAIKSTGYPQQQKGTA